jgi:hypothetical protein
MGGHPFPEILCTICNKTVDLSVDLNANEKGQAVHEECYVKHLTAAHRKPRLDATSQS